MDESSIILPCVKKSANLSVMGYCLRFVFAFHFALNQKRAAGSDKFPGARFVGVVWLFKV